MDSLLLIYKSQYYNNFSYKVNLDIHSFVHNCQLTVQAPPQLQLGNILPLVTICPTWYY